MNLKKIAILAAAAVVPATSMLLASAGGPNLIANGSFSAGVAGWDSYYGNPQPDNGTMKVTNNYAGTGNSYYSGWYCVKNISAGTNYETSGKYFVPEAAPANSGASLQLHYYASNDCSGSNLVTGGGGQSGGKFAAQRGKWLTFSFESVAPATAKSVRVRATAEKEPQPYSSSIPAPHYVLFDDIYFGEASKVIVNPDPTTTPVATVTAVPTVIPTVVPTVVPEPTVAPEVPQDVADDPSPEPTKSPELPQPPVPADEPKNQDEPVTEAEPTKTAPTTPTKPQDVPGSQDPSTDDSGSAPSREPLPPSTGDGQAREELFDTMFFLTLGSVASIVTGFGLLGFIFANRRRNRDQ